MTGTGEGDNHITSADAAFQVKRNTRSGLPGAIPPEARRIVGRRSFVPSSDVEFIVPSGIDVRRTQRREPDGTPALKSGEEIILTLGEQELNLQVYDPGTFMPGPIACGSLFTTSETVDANAVISLMTEAREFMEKFVDKQPPVTEERRYPGLLILETDSPQIQDILMEISIAEGKAGKKNFWGNSVIVGGSYKDPISGKFSLKTIIY